MSLTEKKNNTYNINTTYLCYNTTYLFVWKKKPTTLEYSYFEFPYSTLEIFNTYKFQ